MEYSGDNMNRPNSIEIARTIAIINIIMNNAFGFLLFPNYYFEANGFLQNLIGTLFNIFVLYKFYKGKFWASITYTILSIIQIWMLIAVIKNYSLLDKHNNSILTIVCLVSIGMLSFIIYLLNKKESRNWFQYNKMHNKSPNYPIDNKVEKTQNIYNYTFNATYNNFSNEKDNHKIQEETYTTDYNIIVKCPRCSKKLRVPGDRIVIAKCPNCLLEFKTEV